MKRISGVEVVAGQPIRSAKNDASILQTRAEFLFRAFETIEFRFLLLEPSEESLHQGRNRRFLLRRQNAGSMVKLVVHGNCDVLHCFTVSNQ